MEEPWARGQRQRRRRGNNNNTNNNSSSSGRRCLWLHCLCCCALLFLLVTLQVMVELGQFETKEIKGEELHSGRVEDWSQLKETNDLRNSVKKYSDVGIDCPIILWWSPLTGELGRLGQCGADTCFFTVNRTYRDHHKTRAFLFYDLSGQSWSPHSHRCSFRFLHPPRLSNAKPCAGTV